MNKPNTEHALTGLKDVIKAHLEFIIMLEGEIQLHQERLKLGTWFELDKYCLEHEIELAELYNKAADICGWKNLGE